MKTIFWPTFDFIFLLFVFLIPLWPALNIAADIDLAAVRILILAIFFVWLAGAAFSRQRKILFDFRAACLSAILIFGTLSLVSAPEPGWGLRKLLVFLSIFPLYFIAASFLKKSWPQSERLLKAIFASAAVAAVLGLLQFLGQFVFGQEALLNFYAEKIGPFFWGQNLSQMVQQNPSWLVNVSDRTIGRAFGLFPDPHMMAFFMGMILPVMLALVLSGMNLKIPHPTPPPLQKGEGVGRGLFGVFCLIFVALLLTFSRGGYLGAAFSILAVIILSWRYLGQKKKRVILSALVLGLFILIIFAGPIVSRFVSSFLFNEGSSLGRLQIWRGSWEIFLQNPLLGAGLGNYPRLTDPLALYRSPITSHNLYLDILSETGTFGLLVWLFLIFGSGWQLIRGNRGNKGDCGRGLRIGLFGSLVYFSVHSFFETAIFNPAILATLMLIFSLVSIAAENDKQAD